MQDQINELLSLKDSVNLKLGDISKNIKALEKTFRECGGLPTFEIIMGKDAKLVWCSIERRIMFVSKEITKPFIECKSSIRLEYSDALSEMIVKAKYHLKNHLCEVADE